MFLSVQITLKNYKVVIFIYNLCRNKATNNRYLIPDGSESVFYKLFICSIINLNKYNFFAQLL